jgi:hypothetical protein
MMQQFAEDAQKVLPQQIRDSGTSERALWAGLAGAGEFGHWGPVAAGLAAKGAAAIPYSRPGLAGRGPVPRWRTC